METKTYTRARAAKAALTKILSGHEVAAEVTAIEVGDGRFTAHAEFAPGTDVDALLAEDLVGFSWRRPALAPVEAPVEDVTKVEDLPEALDALGVEPKSPRKPAYVAETSTAVGPTKRVWAIADSMPGATRKQVIDACREAGIAFGTARTQYQKWYKANKVG